MDRNNIYPHCRAREKLNMPKDKNPSILQQQMTWWNSTKYCLLNNASQGCRCVLVSHLVVQRKRRDLQRHTNYADACDVRELSWECPRHSLDLSICPRFWLQLLFLKDTKWLDSCESHVQLKSLIWVMSNLIAAKVKSIEPNANILCSNVFVPFSFLNAFS